ncbi:hypothetical protein E5D57_009967 [Metarhizium anisopliae]|nr:hypothetical protein E5D57_009967 [Metarhizium anisopliae]
MPRLGYKVGRRWRTKREAKAKEGGWACRENNSRGRASKNTGVGKARQHDTKTYEMERRESSRAISLTTGAYVYEAVGKERGLPG